MKFGNQNKEVAIVFVCALLVIVAATILLFGKTNTENEGVTKEAVKETREVVDTSIYASVMPVQVGTKWIYEGKRIFYNPNLKKTQETTAQKIVEITSTKQEGANLRVYTFISYKDEPEFKGHPDSFLINTTPPDSDLGLISGYAFYEDNITYFPLVKGQRLSPSDIERTDDSYVDYVSSIDIKNVLGKQYRCYGISYYSLSDERLEVFCEGLGYIKDSSKHHGTPDEWNYNLVRVDRPVPKN
jgi:hypothetical protein